MKKKYIVAVILFTKVCILMAQQQLSYRVLLDDNQVPKVVRDNFRLQYPRAFMSLWYTSHITYWYEDYAPNWYGAWYPGRQIIVHRFERPTHYEVQFHRNDETNRAIYSRHGQWFETRTKINNLPDTVASSLRKSEFGTWIWSDHQERIEAIGAPRIVYRLQVSNQRVSYILRINESGDIIQVKYN